MTPLVANARMYAVTAAVGDRWRRLLDWVASAAGTPLTYVEHAAPAAPAALEELWSRDDLGLAFMCGYPFARAEPPPHAVAAPLPLDPRCAGRPVYWSDFVVRADRPFRSLADTFGGRLGWTVEHSQSGFNAIRHHLLRYRAEGAAPLYRESVGPLVTPRRIVDAVLSGAIDVGPLDSYVHALLKRFEPRTASRLRVVESTRPTPMPPLVASPAVDAGTILRLRRALVACAQEPAVAEILADLRIAGFAAPQPGAYRLLLEQAAEAEARDYPVPA